MLFETTLTRAQADARAAAGHAPGERLDDALARAVAASPGKVAAVDVHGRLTYAELAARVDACALGLLELGVRPTDVVTAQLPNWNEFVVLVLAAERIGAVVNPIAPIFRERELRTMFPLARPTVAVVAAEFRGFPYPALYAGLAGATPSLRHLVVVRGAAPAGASTWDDLLERGRTSRLDPATVAAMAPDPDAVAELIFTSGTTGEPKGVLHTHNTLHAAVQAMVDAQEMTAGDVVHMASTFAHQTGYLFGARLFVQLGATGVFQDVWDPAELVRLVEREGVTASFGATPFLADVLRAPNLADHDLSTFRVFGCFGAPIPRPLLEQALERLPARVMPGWGMTEVNLFTTTRPGDPPEKVVGSDGAPFPGCELRVLDEAGAEVPAGTEGDLVCRGAPDFVGYVQGRAFTEATYAPGGWFRTGDRATLDADGFLRITGRTKDLVIRGGENVPVKEIEDLLARHPAVAGVAVVGVPDARLGEIGCAWVVPEGEPPTLDDLRALLEEQKVTRQFWPERLEVLDAFPTTPSGKVQKYKLREMAADRAPQPARS